MKTHKISIIRDYFAPIPGIVMASPKLKANDKIVLGVICSVLENNSQFFMSNAYLVKILKMSQSTLWRSLRRLKDTGLIIFKFNRANNRYIEYGPTAAMIDRYHLASYCSINVQKLLGVSYKDIPNHISKKESKMFREGQERLEYDRHETRFTPSKMKGSPVQNEQVFNSEYTICSNMNTPSIQNRIDSQRNKSSASLERVSDSQSQPLFIKPSIKPREKTRRDSRENRNRISDRLFQSNNLENSIDNSSSRSKVATSISNSRSSSESIDNDTSDLSRSIDSAVQSASPTVDRNSDMNASSDQSSVADLKSIVRQQRHEIDELKRQMQSSSLETRVQSNVPSDSTRSLNQSSASKSLEKIPQKRTSKAEQDANVRGYYINHCNQMPSYRAQRKITFIEEHYPQRIGLKALHIAIGKHAHFPLQYAISVADGLNNDSVRKKHEHNQELTEEAVNIVKMFNHYMHTGYHTFGYNIIRIKKMLKAGFKPDDFRAVILGRIRAWKGNRKMEAYLTRMSVVFGKHFDDYLNSAESRGITGQERPRHRRHISKAQMRFDSGVKDSVKYLNDINGYIIAADVHKGDKLYDQTLSHAKKHVEKKHGSKILVLALQKADI